MKPETIVMDESVFNSRLSFKPLIQSLKKMLADGKPGAQKLYSEIISRFEAIPELMQPQSDSNFVSEHKELVEMLMAAVFPPGEVDGKNIYAVGFPFDFRIIFSSPLFQQLFMKPGSDLAVVPDQHTAYLLFREKLLYAYYLIFRTYCSNEGPQSSRAIYPVTDPMTGLKKYFEVKVDGRFINVSTLDGTLPKIPDHAINKRTNQVIALEELQKSLPLQNFVFEGISVIRISDVTTDQVISEIKNELININAFSDAPVFATLENHIQGLLGLRDVKIGITPFIKIDGHFVFSDLHNSNSYLFRHYTGLLDNEEVNECCRNLFFETDSPIVFEELNEDILKEFAYLDLYYNAGVKSLILCPMKQGSELIGMLEIISEEKGKLRSCHLSKLEPIIPLFTRALEKTAENLNNQIDKVIKEKFTAVQPSVEWKFNEVALNYITKKQTTEDPKIEPINFSNVFPLYGSIDIRNSSTERSHAIQLDLIEQLHDAARILRKVQQEIDFPVLKEIEFKIEKYIASASDTLLSDEEIIIHEFLKGQVAYIFHHLLDNEPVVKTDIESYFSKLDPQTGLVYHYRKNFDESISRINEELSKFIDVEQASAQLIYPHYFERYVTDGVEFNIYIGQSITPNRNFNEIYLRNLKMWQLVVLTKAARLTAKLENELSNRLQTTQLILAHSLPISISFRISERKFDVDGAYNIRYEIIKKRIDKVCIKGTSERLTQPGKIGIVYTQPKEAAEYEEYIEFLQNQKLLKPGIERLDLEELHGVVGLKALRVEVAMNEDLNGPQRIQLSNTTSDDLIGG